MARIVRIQILLVGCCLSPFGLATDQRASGYEATDRWNSTATNGSTGSEGTPVTLTWGLVDDGVTISGSYGSSGSDLESFLATYIDPDPNVYLKIFSDSYARLSEVSGLTFVYEPNNTSQAIDNTSAPFGVIGVRPDIRIGGHSIDGQTGSNTLAYNYFPDHGDSVIDTDNVNSFSNSVNNYRLFRNVIMHETGHGLGLSHLESSDSAFLMEPTLNTGFDGPQLDDIRGLHRLYGDPLEKGGGNNSAATATDLGTITESQGAVIGQHGDSKVVSSSESDFVSIDDNSDTDYFSFTINSELQVSLNLIPRGTNYKEGHDAQSQSVTNSKTVSDLTLRLIDTNGSSVITSENSGGAGVTESITEILTPGTYYARVTGTANDIQLYGLDVSALVFSGEDLSWTGSISNAWDKNATSNWHNSGTSVYLDTDNVTFADGANNSAFNQTNVAISGADVNPGSVTFTNSSDTYTISGSHGIVGNTGVTLNGGGTVVLASVGNAYSGNTAITNNSTLVLRNSQVGLEGVFNVESGATMQIGDATAPGNMGSAATINIASGATLDVVDDDGTISMNISGAGNIELREATSLNTDMSGFTGEITQHGGSLSFGATASGTFDSSTTVNLNGGDVRLFPAGAVRVLDAAINVISSSGPNIRVGNAGASELVLNGDIDVTDPDASFVADSQATLTINGNISIDSGVALLLSTGGSGTDGIQVNGDISGAGTLRKANNGEVRLEGSNSHVGNTIINGGTLAIGSSATLASTPIIEVQESGTLDVLAKVGGFTLASGQTLDIAGTVDGSIDASFGTTVKIGGDGTGTITGDYSPEFGATLEIDLFDTSTFDVLTVGGELDADGILKVINAGSHVLDSGDTFDIFDFGTSSGGFDDYQLPELIAGLHWDVSSLLTTGELSVIGLAGDFDGDSDVDGSDFLLWQRTDGSAAALDAWQSNYGESLLTAAAITVPEPSGFAFVSLGGLLLLCRRLRQELH